MIETTANNITAEKDVVHETTIFTSNSPHEKGDQIPDVYAVLQITVLKSANKISFAKLKIDDGSAAEQDFEVSNADHFIPGKFITIQMGDVNFKETIFTGVIVKHGIKISNNGHSFLTLDCRDNAVKLTTLSKNKYFAEDTSDTDAFTEIVKEYKIGGKKLFKTDFTETDVIHEGLVQYNCTDWDFILQRANAAGHIVYTDEGTITSTEPTVKSEADHILEFGDEIIEFEAEIDAKNQFSEIIAEFWDSAKQELITEELKKLSGIDLDKPGNLSNDDLAEAINDTILKLPLSGKYTPKDIKNKVKSELIKSKLARIRGRVAFVSPVVVKPSSTIELKGVGERFNGLTYITGARYEFSKNVWKTDLQFGLDRNWCPVGLGTNNGSDSIPAMTGLYIGIITQLNDEKGEDRVKVRIPIIDSKSEGVWATMARADAGIHRGMFFLPELNDEVIVSFLNNDPRYPIIMGMLNSSGIPAPVEGKEKDNLKGYYSKIGSRLEFDDKKRTIKIQTLNEDEKLEDLRTAEPKLDKNNTILIDDKKGTILIQDKNGNSIELSKKGIQIISKEKIILEAPKVEIKAEEELKTDAGATTIDSSGDTTITGSKINLN